MVDFLSAGLDLARGMALSITNEKTSESAGIPAKGAGIAGEELWRAGKLVAMSN